MTFFGVDVRNGVPVGLGSIAAFGRRGFTPASLFAQGQPGVWYDPSDLGAMFQDSAGTTPVTAVEQAVGLILDKSRGLALGSERVTNGDFSSGTGWTLGSGWSIAGGLLVANPAADFSTASQTLSLTAGKTYRAQITTVSFTSGAFRLYVFDGTSYRDFVDINTPGSYQLIWTAYTASDQIRVYAYNTGAADIASFDNISVREIAGTHAIQPSAASRPVLRNRYNLLTWSEDFSNAAWSKNGTTATATTITENSANSQHLVDGPNVTFDGTSYTFSCEIAKTSTRNAMVYLYTATGFAGVVVNVSAGTGSVFAGSIAGTTVSVVDAGANWKASVTATMPAAVGRGNIYLLNGTTVTYLGDGTSSITVTKADLRRTIDTIYPYQRIEAATVYDADTSKFPLYLAFDGSDDSLYTAANLDLSSTDKVTVFAGVTKLSDAATGVVAELSADWAANNGSFLLAAPNGAATNYLGAIRGTGNAVPVANSISAPNTAVLTLTGDISGDLSILRVAGAVASTVTSDLGTGNFGSYLLNIGRRNNASSPLNGRIQQLIVRGAASSAAEISSTEQYIAGKQGRAL